MTVYIVGFVLSSLFVWLSEKKKNIKLFGIFGIAILTYIATVRGLDIGIDIKFYVLRTFQTAQIYKGDLIRYMSYNPDQVEPLYLLIEYIAANVFKNVHFALFAFSVLTNTFVYLGIKNLRGKIDVTLGWIAYCLLFYMVTLNLMRQFIAVAVIFYLFSNEKSLNWKRAIILSLLAMGFHISGFMGVFLYGVYRFLGARTIKRSGLRNIGVGAFMLLPFIADIAVNILGNIGIISGKFNVYLGNEGDVALGNILFRSVGLSIFLLYMYKNRAVRTDNWTRFILYIAVIDILFLFNNGLFSVRIGKTFSIFEIVYFTIGLNVFKKKGGSRKLVGFAMVCLLFAYWYYQFIVLNSGLVYPYEIDPQLF